MKVVVAAMEHDYGVRERGHSFEYYNVYLPLAEVAGADQTLLYDFVGEHRARGGRAMNARLVELVAGERPDVVVVCPFQDELEPAALRQLRDHSRTVCYLFDDPWRQDYVRRLVPHFDFFTTSDYYMFRRYQTEGLTNVVWTPFGYNPRVYRKLDVPLRHDVSFVGGYSPLRAWIVRLLEREGIRVRVFGRGWNNAHSWIGQEEMVEMFNSSRINLNLSNAQCWDLAFLLHSARSLRALSSLASLAKHREQVKGRHYEINGCGGFQLSHFVPGLNLAFDIDREIAVFDEVRTMPELIRLFLHDEETRAAIARSGHERSLRDHAAQGYLARMLQRVVGQPGAES